MTGTVEGILGGISFRVGDAPIEGNLNMQQAYQAHEAGVPYEIILRNTQEAIMQQVDRMPQFNIGEISDYESMKANLMMKLIPLLMRRKGRRIRRKMRQCKMDSVAGYLRKMAIDGYVINLDTSDIKEVVRLLRICSNNLNQYARRANEGGSIYQGEIRDLQVQLEKIWQTVSGTMEALAAIT